MFRYLERAKAELPTLIKNPDNWKDVLVDYHLPTVARLYMNWVDGTRILLHKIYPCEPRQSLFHAHEWDSAVEICSGEYEMISYRSDTPLPPNWAPPNTFVQVLTKGCRYKMIGSDWYHSVRPIDKPSFSIMVTGPIRDKNAPKREHKPLGRLSHEARAELFRFFSAYRSF